MPNTLDFEAAYKKDWEALAISDSWREWSIARNTRIEELKELRNYLFATSTLTTSNKQLPWSNSTTTPKLTQIRDNLHANYMAALFPQDYFFEWQSLNRASNTKKIRDNIKNYVYSRCYLSGYRDTISRLVLDWIDTGNAFAMPVWEQDIRRKSNGVILPNYTGPMVKRISIYDIVFNPLAESWDKTPKIYKELVTMGDLAVKVDSGEDWLKGAMDEAVAIRGTVAQTDAEIHKSDGYIADGFSSIQHYLSSGYVELLHFFGDIYNHHTGELQRNRIITIVDRAKVIRNIESPGSIPATERIRHAGWRKRPDNLYAMGPLENLVGLQYRIDHLENLKADVFDQIAYPKVVVRGEVQEFGDDLGERIYTDTEGDVRYLIPDATALNADLQIVDLANKMEELAGAPRMAMGLRTPGEKTAFEVQTLSSGANRIFEHKATEFETDMVETTLNDMLVLSKENMSDVEEVQIVGTDGTSFFTQISVEDINGNGLLRPKGAKHFAERIRRVGNMVQLHTMKMSDPTIGVHLSGKAFAKIITDELNEPELYGENVALFEQAESAKITEEIQVNMQDERMTAAEEGL